MNLYKQVINDTNTYVLRNKRLLLIPIYFIVHCIYIQTQVFNIDSTLNASIADYVFYIFQGNDPLIKAKDMTIPIFWVGNLFLGSFITTGLIQYSTTGYGLQTLVRSRSKCRWWLSKCICLFLFTVCYFLIIHIAVLIFCLINKVDLEFVPTASVIEVVFDSEVYLIKDELFSDVNSNLLIASAMVFLTLYALNLLQLLLSLLLNPILSFMITNCCILISVYTDNLFAFAGYAMLHRSSLYVENGMSIFVGFWILLIVIILSIMWGCFIFKKKDVL